jgi:hypothetical protein
MEVSYPGFVKTLIMNKNKSLALGFYHKSNKYTVFLDILLKDK